MVDDNHIAIIGFSQAGFAAWLALADSDTRGQYRVIVPYDGVPLSTGLLTAQDCLHIKLAQFWDPEAFRTPFPDPPPNPTPTDAPGVSWDANTFSQLANAYLTATPNVPVWQTAMATRDIADDLDDPVPGADYPHVYQQVSWYDSWQQANEAIAAYQTVAPPVRTPDYPAKRILITSGGHVDSFWGLPDAHRLYRILTRIGWLHDYIGPFYNPPPTITPGGGFTPTFTPSPQAVEYVVDSYNSTPRPEPIAIPTFELTGGSVWPPTGYTERTLYLRSGGLVSETPPGPNEGSDIISQTWTPGSPAYNVGTAVAEEPAFANWFNHLSLVTAVYESPLLAQDVTLVGSPRVQLWAKPYGNTYQVHVQILEKVPGNATQWVMPFITRANACAWGKTTPPAWFNGTDFYGETRAHKFKEGDRIVIKVTTVDEDVYENSTQALAITPFLGSFEVEVLHDSTRPTNVMLRLLLNEPGSPVFQGGGSEAPMVEPEGTPAPPEPLAIYAQLYPAFTNPGGWRSWATQVWLTCSGGEGAVTCPDDQLLVQDGANQSFTYEAQDEAGHVASVTRDGINIDRTPPQLTESLPEFETFCSTADLTLDFAVNDALSGLATSSATFNGLPVIDQDSVPLVPGVNTLAVDAVDVAGNRLLQDTTLQVNYAVIPDFPPDGQTVNPDQPLSFRFAISDACAINGRYGYAIAELWLTGPDGVEQPAAWANNTPGNFFTYDGLSGWYNFDADVSGLTAG
ncbi:MAG: hypothetical protein AB1791_04650, partial [Chloroflexota bacterium]